MTRHASFIFHLPDPETQTPEQVRATVTTLLAQDTGECEFLALTTENAHPLPEEFTPRVQVVPSDGAPYALQMNRALRQAGGETIIYVDNRRDPVLLKQSALALFTLTLARHPRAGMVYADYQLEHAGGTTDVHLLKYHPGRVRDNQDYGRVFAFRRSVLEKIGYLDETLAYNPLYDLRLRISERADLVHIANKWEGALYRVVAGPTRANVFDYLLAGKEAQLEAEAIVTAHLKRIGAYLPPGWGYQQRPVPEQPAPLKASIIIPVNRRPEFIGSAIESVQNQTVPEVEVVVVVNGGPEDPTIAAVRRYQSGGDRFDPDKPTVNLIVTDINNIGFCLNLGVQQARGEYYVQLDSDDRLKPEAVEKILRVFDSDRRIGMVIGSYEVWEKLDTGEVVRMEAIPVVTHDEWTEENGRNNLLRINGAGAPRSIPIAVIKEMGYFGMNEEPFARNYGEDYDMVLRISERYRIGRIYEPIYEVIRHSGGTDHNIDQATTDRNDEAKDWMRKAAISRRQELIKKHQGTKK
jgi:glycosyltransferase involved in cell wall biosynthesis